MPALSNYLENKITDWLWRGQAFTPPATVYFSLFTTSPTDAGGGVEVVGAGYTRVARVGSLLNFSGTLATSQNVASTGTSGTTYNLTDIQFPDPVGGNWGIVVAMGVFDAATAGNLLVWGAITPSKTINNGDAPAKFAPAAWSFQLDTD